jgi:hypothetical protein
MAVYKSPSPLNILIYKVKAPGRLVPGAGFYARCSGCLPPHRRRLTPCRSTSCYSRRRVLAGLCWPAVGGRYRSTVPLPRNARCPPHRRNHQRAGGAPFALLLVWPLKGSWRRASIQLLLKQLEKEHTQDPCYFTAI